MEGKGHPENIEAGQATKAPAQDEVYVEGTAEERRLLRKIDLHLLPMLWLMYIFNYIDRTK